MCLVGLASALAGCAPEAGSPVPISITAAERADRVDAPLHAADCFGGKRAKPAKWTLIHYGVADQEISDGLVADLNEMEAGHSGTKDVNVLTQVDLPDQDGVWRYRIAPNDEADVLRSDLVAYSPYEPDSGDWRTLAEFGRWSAYCYPAERYMVIVSGHGTGWGPVDNTLNPSDPAGTRVPGAEDPEPPVEDAPSEETPAEPEQPAEDTPEVFCAVAADDAPRTRASGGVALDAESDSQMAPLELATALQLIAAEARRPGDAATLNRVALYGSDACLMQTAEVTLDLAGYATYVLGSEQTEPASGYPYKKLVSMLCERGAHYIDAPDELAAALQEAYLASYAPDGDVCVDRESYEQITMSLVAPSRVAAVADRVGQVVELARVAIADEPGFLDALRPMTESLYGFGDGVDLDQFLAQTRQLIAASPRWRQTQRPLAAALDQAREAVGEAVVSHVAGAQYPDSAGLAVYWPQDPCSVWLSPADYQRSTFAERTLWDQLYLEVRGDCVQ